MASPQLLPAHGGGREPTEPGQPGGPGVLERVLHGRRSDGSTGGALPGEGGVLPISAALPKKYDSLCAGSMDWQSPGCNHGHGRPVPSAPRTAELKRCPPVEETRVCCDKELETSFTFVDENVNLTLASPETSCKSSLRPVRNGCEPCSETLPDLSFISEDELSFGESSGSVDYGFISAVTFLVTGISLVIISYVVPRDVQVDRDSVSAREMERLERESARVGAHLDRCVIAGLCLLTLGGAVLSTLLMVSLWKGEMYRRKVVAYSKRSAKLYGSISLKTRSSPSHSSAHLSLEEEITVETLT
ncbi:transmembrane protein 74 [Cololabis saira]|uniref:transmembrane protein 74 n=1 Tax=Cololabis saira TaxID=129043 RepID=UPI002AD303BF|nr:transmembrane protein 74 [Cololabis saira]